MKSPSSNVEDIVALVKQRLKPYLQSSYMASELVFSGNFFVDGRFRNLEVGVSDGMIDSIGKSLRGERRINIEGPVLPAGTDIHVHFRDPGETEKEDFKTGTISALFGGNTTVFDMPNNHIPITDSVSFEDKLSRVRSKAFCDFGLYSMFIGNNAELIDQRSSGIKIYLGGSTNSIGLSKIDDKQIEKLDSNNKPVIFHAESQECLDRYHAAYVETLRDHNLARPEECENLAVEYINKLKIKKKIAAHLSSPKSVSIGSASVIKEVTPHHIFLNDEMPLGSWGKVNPPLRSRSVMNELFELYLAGKFDIISSDHAPHTQAEKEEFNYAASGIIGVETRIPILLALFSKKILDINIVVRTAITNPANIMDLRKGRIALGYYADFLNFDKGEIKRIDDSRLHSKTKISPFNGFEAIFPKNVIMRGQFLVEDHELIEDHLGLHTKDLKAANP